jgi:hypothetical protein
VKTEKNVGKFKGDIDDIRRVLTPSSIKPRSSPPTKKPFSHQGDAFEDTTFKRGLEIAKT